eukprot:340457_1
MLLPSPKEQEIDGSSVTSLNPHTLPLPYAFAGRSFNRHNDIFLEATLALGETFFRSPDINSNNNNKTNTSSVCSCPGFLKFQHVIIHNPSILTAEFAQKTWMQSLQNNKQLNLFKTKYPIRAGNTSTTQLLELVYNENNKQYPLISTIALGCHINMNTQRPIPICNAQREYINNELASKTKEELTKINTIYQIMKNNMDRMNILLKNSNCLFQCNMQIQHTDLDINHHVNQSTYAKYIENALLEYCNDYYNAKYHVSAITINYVHEMIINKEENRNTFPFCTVKIINDKTNANGIERELVGIIEKDNVLCVEFKLILIEYKHDRLFSVVGRSKL